MQEGFWFNTFKTGEVRMDADVMEKEKGALLLVQEKLPDPDVTSQLILPGVVKPQPVPKVTRGLLYYRRLRVESEAREKKLLAEMEAKYDAQYRKLEESFSQKEKQLLETLQAAHLTECRKLEQAAVSRGQSLLNRMGVVRRQRALAVVAAVLSLAAFVSFRARAKDVSQPVLPSMGSGPVAAPHSADALSSDPAAHAYALAVVAAVPGSGPVVQALPKVVSAPVAKAGPAAASAASVKGNGGNFLGGNLY
jgi:hypothetical protein